MSMAILYIIVPLSGYNGNGKNALVSPEDYDLIKQYTWYMTENGYTATTIKGKYID
jgi:hypothetical protein